MFQNDKSMDNENYGLILMEWKSILIAIILNSTCLPKSPNPATTRQPGINTPVSELRMEDKQTHNEKMISTNIKKDENFILDNNYTINAIYWEIFQMAKCHNSPGHKKLASPGEAFYCQCWVKAWETF